MFINELSGCEFLRQKLLNSLSLIVAIVAALIGLFYLYVDEYLIATPLLVLSIYTSFIFYKTISHQPKYWQTFTVAYFFMATVLFCTAKLPASAETGYWAFAIPTIMYFLFGRKHGAISSLVYLAIYLVIMHQKMFADFPLFIRTSINLSLAYLSVWGVLYVYERNSEKAQIKLIDLAYRDSLTGAFNRLALKQDFPKMQKDHQVLSMVLVDIDHFKKINDKYGHEMGDIVLNQLIILFKTVLPDEYVYRLGGEEFALLIPAQQDYAYKEMVEILQLVEKHPFGTKEEKLSITISAGVSDLRIELSDILRAADKQLYRAKDAGRNQVVMCDDIVKVT